MGKREIHKKQIYGLLRWEDIMKRMQKDMHLPAWILLGIGFKAIV